MKDSNFYSDGGNIENELNRSNAKPEEIIADEINFDTRKGINRSDKVVDKEIIEEIEGNGVTLERLDELKLPIFKYQTQITIHGKFTGLTKERVGGYKNLVLNQNETLGVRYNAIDYEKKKIISKVLRLDREFNDIKDGFNSRMDSKGFELYKRRIADSKENAIKLIDELKEESKNIPSNFIGKKIVNAYQIWGRVVIELLIDLKAIKQDNLWSFISSLTNGRIGSESVFNELLEKEKLKQDEKQKIYDKEKLDHEIENKKKLNELKEKTIYTKAESLPASDEYIVAILGMTYSGAIIKVYFVFRNKTGRKVYTTKDYSDWNEIPKNISDEIRNNRGNKLFDEKLTGNSLKKYFEKGMLYVIYDKQPVKPIFKTETEKPSKTFDVNVGDVILLDTDKYQLIQSKHTKTGDTIYLFRLKSRVDRENYKIIEGNVKAIRGYYSSFVTAFVLKSAISEKEANKLLEGSSLEFDSSNENGGEISKDPKINEAAKESVENLVEKTDITEKQAVEQMKDGVEHEEEHRETLEKLSKGEITVEEAIAETAEVHIEENKNYYTNLEKVEGSKNTEDLTKELSESELLLYKKSIERGLNVDLKRTVEITNNIAQLEGKDRKDNLQFFAEALQYTLSDAEKDVYARFYADQLLYMVGLSSMGFENLERAIEVGAIQNGESLLDDIKAFKQAKETFNSLDNNINKIVIHHFVEKILIERNAELSTQQGYILSAINDLYKLIYFAKGNESNEKAFSDYVSELKDKYTSATELEKIINQSVESINKQTEEEGIEYTEGKYENGTDVYGANIRYKGELAVIPQGRYETKEEVKLRAEKILSEFKEKILGEELQKIIRLEAQEENKQLEIAKNNYPIVLEWSEGLTDKNVGFDYLYQLEKTIKKAGLTNRPNETYIKNKVWFKDYPHEGTSSYVTIYNGYNDSDYNPETGDLMEDYLKKHYKNFDWSIYGYGDNKYATVYQPESEFKDGDLVKVTVTDSENNFSHNEYGYIKGEPIFVRNSDKWKPHYTYNVVDMFDDEKIFNDIIEWRLHSITEQEVKEELIQVKIDKGLADLLTKEEATELSNLYIISIDSKYKEYTETDNKNKYWKERFENEIWEIFNAWFSEVICRYPLMLTEWLNMQVEKSPNYDKHLYHEFFDIDYALQNQNQFFNSLVKTNIGKSKPKGLYELLPEGMVYSGKLPKRLDYSVEPSSDELVNIMKPFMMEDDLRPNMASINFDKNGATSTDTHRLMFIKGKTDKIGIYGYGKIATDSGQYTKRGSYLVAKKDIKYPKYEAVIPKSYSDIISLNRETVERIVTSLKTFKNVNYYGKYTFKCHVSLYKGEVTSYNINFLIDLFESWLKVGFDKLQLTNKTKSLYKGMANRTVLIVSPDIDKFTNNLKGSGSILMAVMINEGGQPNRELERGEMYVDINDGIAYTAGVTDELFSEFNTAHGTFGAETESNEINELADVIELMEETVKENPNDTETADYLDLLKETLATMREKNKQKFECGGKMVYNETKKYKDGGDLSSKLLLFDDNELNNLQQINQINNSLFYRYYPVGVNPFELSFEPINKYGYGIYFLDNQYYYKQKFKDGRLLKIKPNLQNPLIYVKGDNRIPNSEYVEAYMTAVKNDNIKTRYEFTRKMADAGYDSLVVTEPRGTYLVLFSNDPDLYDIEFDTSVVEDDKIEADKIAAENIVAVNKVLASNKYGDLIETEANFLYNNFKQTVLNGNEEMAIWIPSDSFKGSIKKSLLKKSYIDDHWIVFNKPMSYDRNEYALTEKGKNFVNDVQSVYETKIMVNGGGVKKPFNVNKKYTHFAVMNVDGKIVNGWETISDVEGLKYYAKTDMLDMEIKPNQYKILSKEYLIRKGIDPFNWDNWSNAGNYVEVDGMADGGGVGTHSEAEKWWGNDLSLNQQKEYAKKHLLSFEYEELIGNTAQYSKKGRRQEFINKIWEKEGSPKSVLKGLYAEGGGLKANDIPVGTWLEHKTTKTKVKVWNVDPQLGKMQIQDIFGNKNDKWYSASDWKIIPKPIKELEGVKKEWAEIGENFEYEGGGEIETPRALGTSLKQYFKKTYGIDIDTRYIKTVRGLDGSWYEISTFGSGKEIPNEVRKEMLELSYGKPITELGVSNPDNIGYGNVTSQMVSAYGRHWKEWLKSKNSFGGVILGAAVGALGMAAYDRSNTKKPKEAKETNTDISIDVTKLPEKIRFYDDGKDISTRVWERFDNGEWHKITRKQFDDYVVLGTDDEGLSNRAKKSEGGKFVYYLSKK